MRVVEPCTDRTALFRHLADVAINTGNHRLDQRHTDLGLTRRNHAGACTLEGSGEGARVVTPTFTVALPAHLRPVANAGVRDVVVGLRPEHMSFAPAVADAPGAFLCEVVEYIGSTVIVHAARPGGGEVVLSHGRSIAARWVR